MNKYGTDYSERGFESYQVKYRRKKVLEILNRYSHHCIVEIGVGLEPLFQYLDSYEQYYFSNRLMITISMQPV